MVGFKIKYNDKTIYMALPNGVITVEVSNKSGAFRLMAGGFEIPDLYYTWFADYLHEGDEVEITFEDIPERQISESVVVDRSDKGQFEKMLLAQYHDEKQRLVAEGLL